MRRSFLIACFLLTAVSASLSQTPVPQTGIYQFGAYDTPGFDTINRGNLNVHLTIPIFSKPGRAGSNFVFALSYDSLIWQPTSTSGVSTWSPVENWGWTTVSNAEWGYVSYEVATAPCKPPVQGGLLSRAYNFIYHDQFGASHPFSYSYASEVCNGGLNFTGTGTYPVSDNSGYTIYQDNTSFVAFTKTGKQFSIVAAVAAWNGSPVGGQPTAQGTYTDTNGNTISASSSGVFTDTLGQTALTVTGGGTSSSPMLYTYTDTTGTSRTITVNYTNYNIATKFGVSGVTEYTSTSSVPLISSIVYPDSSKSQYSFTYEQTPGASGTYTGRLASVTLQTSGTISYVYTGGSNGIESDGSTSGLNRTTSDGTIKYVRSGVTSTASTTTFTDASSSANTSVSTFLEDSTLGLIYETERSVYNGAATGTPLFQATTCYVSSCGTNSVASPIQYQITTTSLNGIQIASDTKQFSSGFLVSDNDTYQSEAIGYQTFVGADSIDFARPSGVAVTDIASKKQISLTAYNYDTPALGSNPVRGNLTNISPWLNTSNGTFAETTIAYDTKGSPQTSTLTSNSYSFVTTYDYDSTDSYVTSTKLPTPSSGATLATGMTYDANTGLPDTYVDMNGNTTTFKTYDPVLRPIEVDFPVTAAGAGKTVYEYPSPNQTGVWSYMDNTYTTHTDTETLTDGYGRTSRVATANQQGTNPWYQQDYCYDANGRLAFQSYPYQGSGVGEAQVCSGNGDSYTYDALGRPLTVTHGDGTSATYAYNGHATETTSEYGTKTITQIDGHGRLSAVCEVSTGTYEGVAGTSCGLDITGAGFKSSYAYTVGSTGNQITTVTQGTLNPRVFQTDSLGRTVSVQEPESGIKTYTYAYGQLGLIVTEQKPRANQTSPTTYTLITTQYDSVGRPINVNYTFPGGAPDGTPNKTFTYDVPSTWAEANQQTNLKGQLSSHSRPSRISGSEGTIYGYDTMGRTILTISCMPTGCGNGAYDRSLVYKYNLAGMMTSASDGAGDTYTYGRDIAGEMTGITNSFSDATDPASIIANGTVVNSVFGPLSYTLGNGVSQVTSYSASGQRLGTSICSNGSAAAGCGNNGNSQLYGNAPTWTHNRLTAVADTILNQDNFYFYDDLNRLTTTDIQPLGGGPNSPVYNYAYDRFGNRWGQTGGTSTYSVSYNTTTNQMQDGAVYDAAGNMIEDPTGTTPRNTYSYDADGNQFDVNGGSTALYDFDSLNNRVQRQTPYGTFEQVFDIFGRVASIWSGSNNSFVEAKVYSDTGPLAFRDTSTHFEHQNWIGTERMRTSYNGSVEAKITSLPFGDAYATTGSPSDPYDFAGLNRDGETGNENGTYREYSPIQGRWFSPDPYGGSYDPSNPQSFNRYAYALNSPVSLTDSQGLDDEGPGGCLYSDPCGGDPNGGGGDDGGGDDGGGDGGVVNPGDPFLITGPSAIEFLGFYSDIPGYNTDITSLIVPVFGLAPNNGNPANPCSGANPNNLNYTAANGQQHIMQNHMAGGKGPGIYAGDWTAIQLLNQATLTMGTRDPSQLLRDTRQNTYTLQWTAPPMIWPLSLIFTNNIGWSSPGQPTPTNRLVVTTNCSTVVTSYPVPQ